MKSSGRELEHQSPCRHSTLHHKGFTTGSNLLLTLRVQDEALPLVLRTAETQIQHKIYPKSDRQQGSSSKGLNQKGFGDRRFKGCQKFVVCEKIEGTVAMNSFFESRF